MVQGLGQTTRKSCPSVRVDYIVQIQDIRPWPPSLSLRSLRSVVLQWENGEKSSGSTSPVVPSLGTAANDGKIEFNQTFRLGTTLFRDPSVRSGDVTRFRKNCLELHLYELRRDKTSKGRLIGTAVVDLADHGVIKESRSVSATMNCQRNFRNTAQPILYLKIHPALKSPGRSSSLDNSSIQALLNKNGGESVSVLMKEEYAQEAESTTFTEDDASSQSSVTVPGTPPQKEHDEPRDKNENVIRDNVASTVASKPDEGLKSTGDLPSVISEENSKCNSSCSSSVDLAADLLGNTENRNPSCSSSPGSSCMASQGKVNSADSSPHFKHTDDKSNAIITNEVCGNEMPNQSETPAGNDLEEIVEASEVKENAQENSIVSSLDTTEVDISAGNISVAQEHDDRNRTGGNDPVNGEESTVNDPVDSVEAVERDLADGESSVGSELVEIDGIVENNLADGEKSTEGEKANSGSDADSVQHSTSVDGQENHEIKATTNPDERSKYVKSVRSTPDLNHANGTANGNHLTGDGRENGARSFRINERHVSEYPTKDTRSRLLESKVQQLENKIQMLEGELREAAAIEFSLFSVVAEHGSSMAKVHAPARRLSRLYFYACKQRSQSRRASSARSAVSGLVLVAKACGNDVSRLTYWLSNSVMLRVLVNQRIKTMGPSLSSVSRSRTNSYVIDGMETPSLLRWNNPSSNQPDNENFTTSYDWEDPQAFVSALEKVEEWIFSRTVESIWWQTFTPFMQSSAAMLSNAERDIGSYKSNGLVVNDEGQGDYSLETWRTAFKDAFRRLCPVRAGAHECGCQHILLKLVMEQCVSRLDVAMFNAILRESPDEMSMDPVSDPLSDPKVLPIAPGQSSFGTGAQLKNMIGNWSRCLTELFAGVEDCNSTEEETYYHDDGRKGGSFKCFDLLSAVSDLMMLPKDMLLSESVRKEVCPMFGTSMIRRILRNFVPDEFCPDPIPVAVFESLDAGDHVLVGEDSDVMFPYIPPPTTYAAPSASIINGEAGHIVTGLSMQAKSNNSDDELEELNSPLALISIDQCRPFRGLTKLNWLSKQRGHQDALRYELLRDTWRSSH